MSRDPLGKRALFSAEPEPRSPFTVVVHCSACGASTPLSLAGFAKQHLPAWAWLPWLSHPHLMRCPACAKRTWCAVS